MFITLEGGEGAGKSTQMPRIKAWLEARGHRVVSTRQPGGTALSERVRALLLDNDHHGMAPITELLLMFADRGQLMAELVRPARAGGATVLCDRFTDSTFAYQGGGRGLDNGAIAQLAELVHGDCQPDLTLLLDLPPEQGLRRAARRGEANRIEQEQADFYQRVRERYLQLAEEQPGRIVVIDASQAPDAVWRDIEAQLEQRVPP